MKDGEKDHPLSPAHLQPSRACVPHTRGTHTQTHTHMRANTHMNRSHVHTRSSLLARWTLAPPVGRGYIPGEEAAAKKAG